MIDLHIHSNHSDGTNTVKEILQEAQKRKLEVISITDHDSISAYEELEKINVKQYYLGTILYGCEMKCMYQNTPVEILGYHINLEKFKKSKNLLNLQEKYLIIQKEYLKHLKKVGKEIVKNKIDLLICVGKEVKYMIEQAKEDGMKSENIFWYENNEEAIHKLKQELQAEDVILLKASNSLNFTQICEAIM